MRMMVVVMPFLLSGCALERDYVEIRRQPPQQVQPLASASIVGVALEAQDARTTNRDRVSVKKNGYGVEMAPIIATNDVVAEFRQAIGEDLTARGFRLDGQNGRVEIGLLKFYSDFKVGIWAGSAVAEMSADVRVTDPTGRIVFSKVYTVEGTNPEFMLARGSNAKFALEQGMAGLVQAIGSDPAFQAALIGLGVQPRSAPTTR